MERYLINEKKNVSVDKGNKSVQGMLLYENTQLWIVNTKKVNTS